MDADLGEMAEGVANWTDDSDGDRADERRVEYDLEPVESDNLKS